MNRPVLENRWTLGNIISTAAAALTLIGVLWNAASRASNVEQSAGQVGVLVQRQTDNESAIAQLRTDVDVLKQRRNEDAGTVQSMRSEILSRLDRIENKLDQKADKQSLREWTK
jgi:hypothetical protein